MVKHTYYGPSEVAYYVEMTSVVRARCLSLSAGVAIALVPNAARRPKNSVGILRQRHSIILTGTLISYLRATVRYTGTF